ncbi:hypothetical protein KP509_12G050500 [Ceratopteris richardii]|uniref:Uncharacterized protein n=1 Tax=Ceratopteris richardii TaxID=49495 RepID=A0A8T2TKY9_CERRI|nr:hypothetical protein KP509_12G050500 [Ceratopteris richardii]
MTIFYVVCINDLKFQYIHASAHRALICHLPFLVKPIRKSVNMAIVTRSLANPPHVLTLIMATRIPKLLQLEVPEGSAGMKVAEILLECSVGHFLSSFSLENIFESQRGSESKARATPLSADAEVSMHQWNSVYVILSISRVHTRLSEEEKASFCELLNNDRRHKLFFRGRGRLIKFLSKKMARPF